MRNTRMRHGRTNGIMHVRTLGRAELSASGTRLGPEAPVSFSLLLHLVLERDRWVARTQLQEMLFPQQDRVHARHSLRQSVYTLRKDGFPIEGSGPAVHISAKAIVDDYSTLLTPQLEGERELSDLMGGWLAGFEPTISPTYSHWFEGKRSEIALRMRTALLAELAVHKRNARWAQCERTCRAILSLDPLNEEATLGLAEALALTGAKVQAIRILERYQEEMPHADLRLPAKILKRRISEQLQPTFYNAQTPLFGRGRDLQDLTDLVRRSRRGQSLAVVVYGDSGIGKTRLVSTLADAERLTGATVLQHTCQPHDRRRPLGAFADIVPQLRRLPGAIGCSPSALEFLSRVVQFPDPESGWTTTAPATQEELSAHLSSAISELVDAVTSEAPLLVIVDDAHWLDTLSSQVLTDLVSERKTRRVLVVACARSDSSPRLLPAAERLILSPLSAPDARALLAAAIGGQVDPDFVQWAIEASAGNPLYLVTLARQAESGIRSVPPELRAILAARLTAVTEPARRVLAACAALGKNSTFSRLEKLIEVPRALLLEALTELDSAGLLSTSTSQVAAAHPLLMEIASGSLPPVAWRYLHYLAAQLIEAEAASSRSASLLWDAAIHWEEAGSPKQALDLFLRCAEQSLSIGETAEAMAMIHRTQNLAISPEERQRYCLIAIRIARAAVVGELLEAASRELLSLCPVEPSARQEALLGLHEAEVICGRNTQLLASALMETIRNGLDSGPFHARAVNLLLMSLANIGDSPERARSAYLTLPPSDVSSSLDRQWAELVYQSSFGDPLKAKVVAEGIFAEWKRDRTHVPFRTVTHCGNALVRAGHVTAGLNALNDVVETAVSLGLSTVAFRTGCDAGLLHFGTNDIIGARRWLERVEPYKPTDGRAHANWLYLRFLLAVLDADAALARTSFDRLLAEAPPAGDRGRLIMGSMQARLDALTSPNYSGPSEDLTQLFAAQSNRADTDLPALMLVEACEAANQHKRATWLASIALSKRVDRNPPPERLRVVASRS
ncbi:MAG: ATP-binding protein [Gemmatimonadaceae bacterium]